MAYSLKACHKASRRAKESNDCAVFALALTTHLSYEEAQLLLRKHGRLRGKGAPPNWINAFKEAGYELEWFSSDWPTIKSFEKAGIPKDVKYLIRTNGHALAAARGKVLDWTKGRQHHIKEIYKVNKIC